MAREKTRDEYAGWLAAPKKTKLAMGLPMRQTDFAELKGISTRTLQRWKKDPEFQLLVQQKKAKFLETGMVPDSTGRARPHTHATAQKRIEEALAEASGELAVGESEDETRYLRMQAAIVEKAMEGDYRAQELYLKYWGKSFIEAEQSADDELAALTDAELVNRMLTLVGTERVAAWLAAHS